MSDLASEPTVQLICRMIAHVAATLIGTPQLPTVSASANERIVEFAVKVPQGSTGKVIGKEGKTVEAIRLIAKNAYYRDRSLPPRDVFVAVVNSTQGGNNNVREKG